MKVVIALAPVWQSSTPPLSLAFLKASLAQAGYDAYCIDFSILFRPIMVSAMGDMAAEEYIASHPEIYKKWAKQIADEKPDVVGFSILMSNIKNTALIAQEVRNLLPEVIIVSGGPSLTRENLKYIKYAFRFSDYIVEGEGEQIFVELMTCLKNKGDVSKLKQMWLKDEHENISYTGVAPLHNIDLITFPDFKDFDRKAYPVKNKLPLLFSRGCILNCNYCENKWNHLTQRSRSAGNVLAELKRNVEEYGMEQYIFNDDSLISSKTMRQLDEYCDMVMAEGLIMPWHVYGTRVERLLTEPFVAKLRKSGMYGVSLGIESFSSKVQKEMGKSSRYDDADKSARLFSGQGIKTETWIIYGYPTETDAEFAETLNWFIQNPNLLSHVTANTFGPNAKYQHDRPGVIQYTDSNAWNWYGPESTLEKRKIRFLQLAEVMEETRVNSKGKFTFHVGDPYYVKYFNTFTRKDKMYLLEAWERLEGTYVEKNPLKKWLYTMGALKETKFTTIVNSQNVVDEDFNDDDNLNLLQKRRESLVTDITIKEILQEPADVAAMKLAIGRNLERALYELKGLSADEVKTKMPVYESKMQTIAQGLQQELDENVFYGLTYRELPETVIDDLDTSESEEIIKDMKINLLPKLKRIKAELNAVQA